ncbi:MAG: hypothetical protein ABW039_11925 [Sphingobium sp.]
MMLGLSLAQFTIVHVAISLIAIAAGLLFFGALLGGRWLGRTNALFLLFTILTSVTGFLFPPKPIGPPFIFGVVSLILLAVALYALSARRGPRGRRLAYLLPALAAQWLNMVVLVVQAYQKVPALNALAPTGTEPALLATQGVVLLAVVYTGWRIVVGSSR